MVAPFSKFYRKIWVSFCLNTGKRSMYQRPKFPCSYFLKALKFYLTLVFLCEYPEVISETSATIIYVMMIKSFFVKWFTNKSPLNFLFFNRIHCQWLLLSQTFDTRHVGFELM